MKALHQLNDREKQIMELRFGLAGGEEKTQKMWRICLGFHSHTFRVWKKNHKRLRKEFNKMV